MAAKKKPTFNITSLLNDSSLAQADNQHKKIPYDKLIPHEKNHYEMSDIEQIAATIEQFGVLQPLMVKPIVGTDTYKIVSGHRRHAGVAMLVETEGLEDLREIPCYVMHENEDETITELKLHISNTTARELSEHDKMVAVMELKALIQQAKERDITIKGKMRDLIAEAMNLGTTQVQKYLNIGEQADEEIIDALREGEVTVQEAYETTRKPSSGAKRKPITKEDSGDQEADSEGNQGAESDENATVSAQNDQGDIPNPRLNEDAQEDIIDDQEAIQRKKEAIKAVKTAIKKFDAFKAASEAVNNDMLHTLINRVEKQLGKITKETEIE